jgi:hypothetical protein
MKFDKKLSRIPLIYLPRHCLAKLPIHDLILQLDRMPPLLKQINLRHEEHG